MRMNLYFNVSMLAFGVLFSCQRLPQQTVSGECNPDSTYWHITPNNEIAWNITKEKRLPHEDNMEMSGRKLSSIITYKIDSLKHLSINRLLIFPTLRTLFKKEDPEWSNYRAYLKRNFADNLLPEIYLNGKMASSGKLASQVKIDGILHFREVMENNILLERALFPSPDQYAFIENWTITNQGEDAVNLLVTSVTNLENEKGANGDYEIRVESKGIKIILTKGQSCEVPVYFTAKITGEETVSVDAAEELDKRNNFLNTINQNLVLVSPDSILNTAFAFAKIRTSESLFDSKMGLVHSPGGGRYYAGVWANDQVEYAGPFFPFLGYAPANDASMNAYRIFAKDMKFDYSKIWSSHEMEGDLPCCSRDRGDAAMYAYGASRFAITSGKKSIAEELWPAIQWALEYCHRKTNSEGVITSETDEMEGRIATGTANLSTSVLTYGALITASHLANDLGKTGPADLYLKRADSLRTAIEAYFGADIEGFHTYKYFKEHQKLRHWICLPLTVGIYDRKEGTIDALFNRLWTINGLNVETGESMFWDRGTLYALRGVFMAGEPDRAYEKLKEYTCRRLLGNHVPYPVEAWPEGNQAHLAAESALYCRIFTEGLFGISPTGLASFDCSPSMPAGWNRMALKNINAFGNTFDLIVTRVASDKIRIEVASSGKTLITKKVKCGETIQVKL